MCEAQVQPASSEQRLDVTVEFSMLSTDPPFPLALIAALGGAILMNMLVGKH
jgi:hypothetical protein